MSIGAWIFASAVVIAIAFIIHGFRVGRPAPSTEIDRLIAAARASVGRPAAAPVDVDWTGKLPIDSHEAPMPIRTIGSPQPGDEVTNTEKAHATRVHARAIVEQQSDINKQLDILRKTRHQRDVGTVKVPLSLSVPIVIDAGPDQDDAVPRG